MRKVKPYYSNALGAAVCVGFIAGLLVGGILMWSLSKQAPAMQFNPFP